MYGDESLSPEHIRLLHIESGGDTPVCRLKTYPAAKAPKFDALSYHWGGEILGHNIKCNGHLIPITRTLYDAIRRLRKYPVRPQRPIWIDAICLDQNNEVEKATHVPLMSRVFSNAQRVLVWLGEAPPQCERAFEVLPRWLRILKECEDDVWHNELLPLGIDMTEDPWLELGRIFAHPWFGRLWCFQEAALAKKAFLMCGKGAAEWNVADEFLSEIERLQLPLLPPDEPEQRALDCFEDIRRTRSYLTGLSRSASAPGESRLADLLLIAQMRACTEPIDRIWALMGILLPEQRDYIRQNNLVDYSPEGKRQFWKAYIGIVKFEILRDPQLKMFSLSSPTSNLSELPSWCPDFNSKPETAFPGFFYPKYHAGLADKDVKKPCGIREVPDSHSLLIPGFNIDRVFRVNSRIYVLSHVYDTKLGENGDAHKALLWDQECLQMAEGALGKSQSTKLAFLKAFSDTTGPDGAVLSLYDRYIQLLQSFVSRETDRIESLSNSDKMSDFAGRVASRCEGRAFFITEHGRLGLGNPRVQPGDEVCIFHGGWTPYLLRPESGAGYRFIGAALIPGLMQGEAFSAPDKGPEDTFLVL